MALQIRFVEPENVRIIFDRQNLVLSNNRAVGIGIWIVSAAAAAGVARLIPAGRDGRWILEGLLAIAAGFLLGLVATVLDFGGWNEIDWRAALFAATGAFAAVGILRLIRLWS